MLVSLKTRWRTHRPWLAAAFCTVGLALSSAGCADEVYAPEYPECRCDVETCGPSDCSFQLTLDENCNDDVEFAEVLVGEHLEVDKLLPGETYVPCTRVPVGSTATLFIRGGSWIWDQTRRCEAPDPGQPGRVIALTLQCSE